MSPREAATRMALAMAMGAMAFGCSSSSEGSTTSAPSGSTLINTLSTEQLESLGPSE